MFGNFFDGMFGGRPRQGYYRPRGQYAYPPDYDYYDNDDYYYQQQQELERQRWALRRQQQQQRQYEMQRRQQMEQQKRYEEQRRMQQEQEEEHQRQLAFQQLQRDANSQKPESKSTKIKVGQQQNANPDLAAVLDDIRNHLDTIQNNSSSRINLFESDSRINERTSVQQPQDAFKTYSSNNRIQTQMERVEPLDRNSNSLLKLEPNMAIVEIPKEMVDDLQISANGAGVLNVLLMLKKEFQQKMRLTSDELLLKYQLPAYYERADITAKQEENCYKVFIPLSACRDDQMIISIQ